jgi:hypothetical protein
LRNPQSTRSPWLPARPIARPARFRPRRPGSSAARPSSRLAATFSDLAAGGRAYSALHRALTFSGTLAEAQQARGGLGDDRFLALHAAGAAAPLDHVIERALGDNDQLGKAELTSGAPNSPRRRTP